jgi:tetratricopeptide (TPR) repeat protein
MQNIFPRAIALIFIPLAIYVIYIAAHWGMADVYYRPAFNQLKSWRLGKVELENKDWEKLQLSLSRAVELDPNNPEIYESLALAFEGGFDHLAVNDEEAEPFRKQALEAYRQSTLLRPVWPYAWSKLAAVKYRLGQIDDEFYQAFHHAERLGPWEPIIQRQLIEIGLLNWLVLSMSERNFVLNIIAKGLEKQPREVLHIANNHGLLDIVCLLNKKKLRVSEICQQYKK